MATGINAVQVEAIVALARLPDMTPESLDLLYIAMIAVIDREGAISVQSVYKETDERWNMQHLLALFFTLAQAGVLTHCERDRRGFIYDTYQFEREHLSALFHDVTVASHVLKQVQITQGLNGSTYLIATLPDTLSLDADARRSIPSLAASLHRLITEAKEEIVVLNPFFEQVGFDRLKSALLAAAEHGVAITIITQQLKDLTSVNHRVLRVLSRKATDAGLSDRFRFYEYQQVDAGRATMAAHAKFLLADREKAYLGSANLTEYGMARQIEVGVILQGLSVHFLYQIFKAILAEKQTEEVRFSVSNSL